MAPGELSEYSLRSPRTGTPVKLLGREDASVDWYNLEKSKRVKAFRCGEFDDCIEKAESTPGMPIKKREKYARREDAILHALELEKQLLADHVEVPVASDSLATKLSDSEKKKLPSIPEDLGNNHGHIGITRFPQASRVDVDVLNETDGSPIHSQGTKYSHQRSWEDEHAESTPRMRGLRDLGLRAAPKKRKYYPFESDISLSDDHRRAPSSSSPTVGRMSYTNGNEQTGSVVRSKRSRCVYFPSGIYDPFDDKENSFDQIRMPQQFEGNDFNGHRGLLKEENSSSGVMEDEVSNYSQSDSLGSESDSSETEQDTDDDSTGSSESEPDALGYHEALGNQESTSSEELDGSPFSGDIAHLYPDDPYLANEAVYRWPLKRKRNTRYVTREFMPGNNEEYGRPSLGMYNAARTMGQSLYSGHGAHIDGKYVGTQMAGSDNGFPHSSRFPSRDRNLIDGDDEAWEGRSSFKGQWEDGRKFFNPMFYGHHNFGGRPRSMLVNVDLKVRSSYPRERVPIISLLSKLNGRAIVGHPIQIEALEDGSSESLIPKDEYHIGERALLDGSPTLTSSWKTARRSKYRVPRPHVSPVLGGDEASDFPSFTEQERQLPFKKTILSSLGQNSSLLRKGSSSSPRPLLDKQYSRKSSKKVILSSNQKTRTLSSIQHGFGTKTVHDTRGCQMDGLIKAETSGPTTVACIPVKLVFSRLLEKINRPPLKALS